MLRLRTSQLLRARGVHACAGAALTGLAFATPGAAVLEIRNTAPGAPQLPRMSERLPMPVPLPCLGGAAAIR